MVAALYPHRPGAGGGVLHCSSSMIWILQNSPGLERRFCFLSSGEASGYGIYTMGRRRGYLENSYIAYELEPVKDPEADWRLDVGAGSTRLPVLINDYMRADSGIMEDYHRDGIAAGFLCYPLDGFTGEGRTEEILTFRTPCGSRSGNMRERMQ